MKIGWIGLGKMGVPMSQQLLSAGHSLIVYNRTKEKEGRLIEKGAEGSSSPQQLMEKTKVIFLMISDDEAVRNIFNGRHGLLNAGVSDRIIINMSTVSPDISKKMGRECRQKGNEYLDAPVSGSVPQARNRELAVIVGGDKETYKKVKPLLETLGKSAIHVGDIGAGNAAKLAINTLLGVITEGLAEVINFAAQMNIDAGDLLSIINDSALGSPFIKMKGDAVLQDDYDAAFTLEHLAKDLRLAHESGLDASVGNKVYEIFQDAEPTLGREDVIAIIKYVNKNTSSG